MSHPAAWGAWTPILVLSVVGPLAGCLQFDEVDLFPVCEDRRAEGPSPPYTVDELRTRVPLHGEISPGEQDALLGVVRERVLTLKGAPYRNFTAMMHPEEFPTLWRFRGNGTGGLDPTTNDTYDFQVRLEGGLARAVVPEGAPHPTPATQTLARLAVSEAARDPALAEVRNGTPELLGVWLDPDLPACAFLQYGGEGGARSEVVVNLARLRVVHVAREGP
jgi:hypothetical protein